MGHVASASPTAAAAYKARKTEGAQQPEDRGRDWAAGHGLVIGSLPAHLSPHMFEGFKCPVCSKFVPSFEMDLHLVMCLTKPRIIYTVDVLSKGAGESAICLEELQQANSIV